MNVHYDVEKTLTDMRAGWSSFKLKDSATPFEKIALRHREVFAQLVKMTLESENAGFENIDVLEAGQMLVCDWLAFMASVYEDEEAQAAMVSLFVKSVLDGAIARIVGGNADQTIEIQSSTGGHA